ncbi:MAG: hypothetical protein KME06_15170 [Kastovskya adunca ATA6-11-RM4]|nr:hypothetical protein [Kastovskya adunca ATA6-11-RM4]
MWRAGEPGSRGAGAQGSRGAGEPGSRGAGVQGRREAGEPGSRGAGAQGSRGAGERGEAITNPIHTSYFTLHTLFPMTVIYPHPRKIYTLATIGNC